MAADAWDEADAHEEDAEEEQEADPTFGRLLEEAVELLRDGWEQLPRESHPHPREEAIRLFRWVRGPSALTAPLPEPDEVIEAERSCRYLLTAKYLGEGMPFAYAVGWTGFRHLAVRTDARALIPRPETEGLVDLALLRVRDGVAADVGTGTGALALSLAQEGEFTEVIGTDISERAIDLATNNGMRNLLPVTWRVGDLLAPLQGERLSLLVSNPPYLSTLEYDALDRSVREHEPATALIGGRDGLDFYRRLLAEASGVMAPGGWIALEIDARRPRESAEIATAHGWTDVRTFDDLFGRPRYLLARWEPTT